MIHSESKWIETLPWIGRTETEPENEDFFPLINWEIQLLLEVLGHGLTED